MFTRNNSYVRSNGADIDSFIEDFDISNSELLYRINNYSGETKEYLITKFEKRIDLISKDIYGDDKYSWIILYFNKISDLSELKRKVTIKYIPISELENLINEV